MTAEQLEELQRLVARRCSAFTDLVLRYIGGMRVVVEYKEPDGTAVKHVVSLDDEEPLKKWETRIMDRIARKVRYA